MINEFLKYNAFDIPVKQREKIFLKEINQLTNYHYNNCLEYKKILNLLNFNVRKNYSLEQIPFTPTRLFKHFDLISSKKKTVYKTLRSSGTTDSNVSRIYLDRKNVNNQIKVLSKIVSNFLGKERLPMLIIDSKRQVENPNNLTAKNAAIRGFSIFGKNYEYLLNDSNEIDYEKLNKFLFNFGKKKFLVFGFTIDIFQFLINEIDPKKLNLNFKNSILLHGGGWKKLESKKIKNDLFKKKLLDKLKINKIFNYYGMVEQTGSIFVECNCGKFISSIFSDIIIRDEKLKKVKKGNKGLIQLLSVLPTSYPGHSILTEDIGEILDEDGCIKCKLHGKSFIEHGRAEQSEVRGCSDV